MECKVIYFSRTGNSKRIAEKISGALGCEIVEITDDKDWSGKLGYINAGRYAMTGKMVNIKLSGPINGADNFILVSPVWAGRIAPAVRAFLNEHEGVKCHMVMSSISSKLANRDGYASVWDVTEKEDNEDEVIRLLIDDLKNKEGDMKI